MVSLFLYTYQSQLFFVGIQKHQIHIGIFHLLGLYIALILTSEILSCQEFVVKISTIGNLVPMNQIKNIPI